MRVRLAHQITGTRNGEGWPPIGTVVDLPDQEAIDLLVSGAAVEAGDEAEVETAAEGPDESGAVEPPAKRPAKRPSKRAASK